MKILNETLIEGGKKLEFEFEGRNCILCIPDNPREDKRVLWRAEFFHAFEKCDVEMFKKGYYRAYIGVSNMFGSPVAVEIMKKFHDFLVSQFGLCDRMILVGLSRGGFTVLIMLQLIPKILWHFTLMRLFYLLQTGPSAEEGLKETKMK